MGSRRLVRWSLYATLAVAYVLHNDLWLWDDPHRVLGLPVGLTYHVGFCLVVAGLMWALQRFAWPRGLEDEGER